MRLLIGLCVSGLLCDLLPLSQAVQNLMSRYGEDLSVKTGQHNKEFLELESLESLKRAVGIYAVQTAMLRDQERVSRMDICRFSSLSRVTTKL